MNSSALGFWDLRCQEMDARVRVTVCRSPGDTEPMGWEAPAFGLGPRPVSLVTQGQCTWCSVSCPENLSLMKWNAVLVPSRTVIVWWHVVSIHCHHLFEIMKFIVIKKEWVCGLSAPWLLAGKISASSPCHLLHTCGFHSPPWKQTYLGDFSFFWLPGVVCRISEFPGQGLNTQSLGNETAKA